MTFVIIGGGIDLSVGALVALASVWATTVATAGLRRTGVMVLVRAAGRRSAAGLVNGVLIAYGRLVPFIVDPRDAGQRPRAGGEDGRQPDPDRQRRRLHQGHRPRATWSASRCSSSSSRSSSLVGWVLLNRTTFGRRTFAIGGNAEAARLAGIDVRRHTVLLYALSGLCCGIAAVMLMARTTTGSSTHGNLYELDAIAAVIIGGTLLSGGRGTLIGSILGVLVFTTITNIFILNNLATEVQNIAKGLIIVAAVLLQSRATRRPPNDPEASALARHLPSTSGGTHVRRNPPVNVGRRRFLIGAGALGAGAVLTACTSNSSGANAAAARPRRRPRRAAGDNDKPRARRSPSASPHPQADHGWIGAITANAKSQAGKYTDVTLEAVEGTNDVNQQISQVETLISKKVDVIVILPFDGKALTETGAQGDARRHPGRQPRPRVRQPARRRAPGSVGDNYGMGVAAGTYVAAQMKAKGITNP